MFFFCFISSPLFSSRYYKIDLLLLLWITVRFDNTFFYCGLSTFSVLFCFLFCSMFSVFIPLYAVFTKIIPLNSCAIQLFFFNQNTRRKRFELSTVVVQEGVRRLNTLCLLRNRLMLLVIYFTGKFAVPFLASLLHHTRVVRF